MMIHGLTVISIAVTLRRGAQLGPLGRVVLELVLEGEDVIKNEGHTEEWVVPMLLVAHSRWLKSISGLSIGQQ